MYGEARDLTKVRNYSLDEFELAMILVTNRYNIYIGGNYLILT